MSLANYRFAVEIDSRRIGAFTECMLPSIEWDIQQVREGGQNGYVHQLPKGRKPGKLTLKRGLGHGRELLEWYMLCLQGRFIRRNVTIHLIGAQLGMRYTAFSWTAMGAFPTKWTGPKLQSSGKAVAIETLQLACNEVVVTYNAGFLQLSELMILFQNAQSQLSRSMRRLNG